MKASLLNFCIHTVCVKFHNINKVVFKPNNKIWSNYKI